MISVRSLSRLSLVSRGLKELTMRAIKNKTGFTFFEILIGTLVLLIGIAGITSLVLWGRLVLKQSENKAAAMNVAFTKMEEYLAKSYSRIGTTTSPDADAATVKEIPLAAGHDEGLIFTESGKKADGNIDWLVNVFQRYEGNKDEDLPDNAPKGYQMIPIPYKEIEVKARYQEESPRQKGAFYQKEVRLLSYVPYPLLHAVTNEVVGNIPQLPEDTVPGDSATNYRTVGGINVKTRKHGLQVELNYETPKDLFIIYNIAIKIDPAKIKELVPPQSPRVATMYTSCVVDHGLPVPTETRTPILSQPLISNAIALTGAQYLKPGRHVIEVQWYKDVIGGVVSLRNANIIAIAVEHKL